MRGTGVASLLMCCAAALPGAAGQRPVTAESGFPFVLEVKKLTGGDVLRNWINGAVASADGQSVYLGVGSKAGDMLEEWGVQPPVFKRRLDAAFKFWRSCAPLELLSADRLLVAAGDALVEVDLADGTVGASYDTKQAGLSQLGRYIPGAASPDGAAVFAAGESLVEFSRETRQLMKTHYTGQGKLNAVSVSPDSKHVAFGGDDGTLRRLERATGAVSEVAACASGELLSVRFSSDSSALYFGCYDTKSVAKVKLDGTQLWSADQDIPRVRYLAETPDGKYVISSAGEYDLLGSQPDPMSDSTGMQNLYQWDAATGKRMRKFITGAGLYLMPAVTGDGRRMYTGSSTTTLWGFQLFPYGNECPERVECDFLVPECTIYDKCSAGRECRDPDENAAGNYECCTPAGNGGVASCAQAVPPTPETTVAPSPPLPPSQTPKPTPAPMPLPPGQTPQPTSSVPATTPTAGETTAEGPDGGADSSDDGSGGGLSLWLWVVLGTAAVLLVLAAVGGYCFHLKSKQGGGEGVKMYELENAMLEEGNQAPVQHPHTRGSVTRL